MNVGDAAIMGVVSGHIIVLRGSLLAIIIAVAFCFVVHTNVTRRSPPSRPILAALRVWLADPGGAQAEEPPQAPGGSNGASRPPAAPVAIVAPAPAQTRSGVGPPQACAVSPRRRYRRRCAAVRAMMRTIAQCRGARGPAWQPGAITARGTLPDPGTAADRQRSDPAELCRPMRARYGPAGSANVTTMTFAKQHEFAHLFGYRINRRPQGRHI